MKRSIWDEIKESFKKNKGFTIIMIIFIAATYIGMMFVTEQGKKDIEEISYNQFWEYVEDGKVDTIYYNTSAEYMTVTLLNADTKDMSREQRNKYTYTNSDKRRVLYPGTDCNFRERILKADTNIRVVQSSWIGDIGRLLITVMLYVTIFVVAMKVVSGPVGSTKEKDLIQTSDVSFDSIIGHEEIIDDVKFITELMKNPKKGDTVGAKLPKGLLFAGPPGTGKTLLAKAIAHEAGVPFLYQNASGLIEIYVGLGARRVRNLFKIAKKNAPCIIFMDEIDAIGGKRGESKGTSENEQTINALLQEMDGFNGRDGIFIIAATNRPESLDDALVRSGRFDRRITVNPPRDWTVRKQLFEHYLKKFNVSDDVDIDNLSKQVSGFTGADIAMVCNEASIIAVMHDKEVIDSDCIEEAIDKKIFHGNRSKSESHEADRNIVAYHEAGHAIMTYLTGQPVARASIQFTTSGVGGVVFSEDSETMFQTADDLRNSALIAYAGRASEEIKFKRVTTGASNDITKATQIMVQYIEHLGFDGDFGLLDVSVLTKSHFMNSDAITARLSAMSTELYKECKARLSENYDLVEKVAAALLERNVLTGSAIKKIIGAK